MKKRLKGLLSLHMVVLLLIMSFVSAFPVAVGAEGSAVQVNILFYTGTTEIQQGTQITTADTAVVPVTAQVNFKEQPGVMNLLSVPTGKIFSGWDIWETTQNADGYLVGEHDSEQYPGSWQSEDILNIHSSGYIYVPVYIDTTVDVYTGTQPLSGGDGMDNMTEMPVVLDMPLDEQTDIVNLAETAKPQAHFLDGWKLWKFQGCGGVYSPEIMAKNAPITTTHYESVDFRSSDSGLVLEPLWAIKYKIDPQPTDATLTVGVMEVDETSGVWSDITDSPEVNYQWHEYGQSAHVVANTPANSDEIGIGMCYDGAYSDAEKTWAGDVVDIEFAVKAGDVIEVEPVAADGVSKNADVREYTGEAYTLENGVYTATITSDSEAYNLYIANHEDGVTFKVRVIRESVKEAVLGQTTKTLTAGTIGQKYACKVTVDGCELLSDTVTYAAHAGPQLPVGDTNIFIGGEELKGNYYYKYNSTTMSLEEGSESDYNAYAELLDVNKYNLKINNLDVEGDGLCALYSQGNELTIDALGANILLGADSTGTSEMSTGVGIDGGSLTIKGEGSLYAYGGDAANSYGIRVSGGVSIIGGSIKAVSGAGTVAQQALYTDIDVDFGQDKWYQWKTDESSDWTIALNDEYSYTNNGNSTYLEIEKANACKVDFDANGGSNIAETVYVSIGSEYKIPPCMFTPPRDYTFAGWSLSKGGSVITTEGITVNSDTILYAVWNRMGGATVSGGGGGGDHAKRYTVKFETYGGTEIEYQRVARYGYVTKPDAPEKVGYSFDGWYADEKFEKLYDFNSEVSSGFTLYAKWKEITYADVNADAWYYESVKYAVSKGLLDGAGNNEFAPDSKATRAMLITALYRMEGEPATNRSIPFADVDMTAYYANAVIWAKQNGIINGVTETEFAPDAYITREQFVTVIYRYAIYKGMNAVTMEENLYFEDVAEISEYAVPAMNWAVGTELIKGKSETMLNPRDSVTKAETAAILYRFIKMK